MSQNFYEPQKVQDYGDLKHVWNVIQNNTEERQEIYAEARQEAIQEIGKAEDDPEYIALSKEVRIANDELDAARAEETAAALERNGDGTKKHPGTAKELAIAQANLDASLQADNKHSGFLSSIGYKSQTSERTADRDDAKRRDDAAQKRQAKAREAREQAQKRQAKALEARKQYTQERNAVIKQLAYQHAPVLHEYDKALAHDRSYYKKAKTIERRAERLVERSRDNSRSFR